jgi:uncharacterized protein (TIGR00255 family)
MTGFGRAEAEIGQGLLVAEVRCVNSRHLDVRLRLPRDWSEFEIELRKLASVDFARGQVDVSVRTPGDDGARPEIVLDVVAARGYARAARQLSEELNASGVLSIEGLLSLPGVTVSGAAPVEREALRRSLRNAVAAACQVAAEMRAREGESLDAELRKRLDGFAGQVEQIAARSDEVRGGLQERLEKRVAALGAEIEVDPARLAQEVVLLADRMDVTEEIVRLRSHVAQFRETLGESGAVGRKLEFLLQEFGREVNTIGSKAGDGPTTALVVSMKTDLEKLREQVLNVE